MVKTAPTPAPTHASLWQTTCVYYSLHFDHFITVPSASIPSTSTFKYASISFYSAPTRASICRTANAKLTLAPPFAAMPLCGLHPSVWLCQTRLEWRLVERIFARCEGENDRFEKYPLYIDSRTLLNSIDFVADWLISAEFNDLLSACPSSTICNQLY